MGRDQLEKLMSARSNKTFSLQEKVMEKAKLESIGVSETEMENLHDLFVEQHTSYFTEFAVDGVEPDAIIFDNEYYAHKAIWYTKPKGLEDQANIKYKAGSKIILSVDKEIDIHVDIFQHQTIQIENNGPLMIWIGSKDNAYRQLDDIYTQAGIKKEKQHHLKFCPNIAKLEKDLSIAREKEEKEKAALAPAPATPAVAAKPATLPAVAGPAKPAVATKPGTPPVAAKTPTKAPAAITTAIPKVFPATSNEPASTG